MDEQESFISELKNELKKDKIFKFCIAVTIIGIVLLALMALDANAQTQITPSQCTDYCDSKTSTFYLKGLWDEKAKICKYTTQTCKYGCEPKSARPMCAELPTTPPANATDYSDTLWNMVRNVYDTKTGSMSIHGTEYQTGDSATVFLQLTDKQSQFVNSGSCYLDIYYPNQPNLTHAQYIYDAPMNYKNGSDGLYYYDLTIPNVTGVYMLSATCSYSYMANWFYPPYSTRKSNITVVQGSYEGDTDSLNSYEDALFMRCASGTPAPQSCIATYSFNLSTLINITNINIFYSGENSDFAKLYMFVWNWSSSSWVFLPNVLIYSGRALSGTPTFIGDFISNSVPLNNTINGTNILFMLKSNHTGSFKQYDNWLSLNILTAEGIVYELKGSGELHVSNALSNLTVNINSSQLNDVAKVVWEYSSRNLTYYQNLNPSEIALYVWNATNRTVNLTDVILLIQSANTSIQQKIDTVNTAIINMNNSMAQTIWSYSNRTVDLSSIITYLQGINATLTSYYNDLKTRINELANLTAYDVWNYQTRNLTFYPVTNVDYSYIQSLVWNATTRNLTDDIANLVWNYQNRNLTFINFTDVLNAISQSNSSVITEIDSINSSIFNKLYLIQGDLNQINSTLNVVNTTAWDIDYWVKQNHDILLNLTLGNVSVFADINWTMLREQVWNKTSEEKVQSDLLSLADNDIQLVTQSYYCANDTTLAQSINITRCIFGTCYSNIETSYKTCDNGCAMNECRQPQYITYGIILIIIVIVCGAIFYFGRDLQW